jgi:hypothetical protein
VIQIVVKLTLMISLASLYAVVVRHKFDFAFPPASNSPLPPEAETKRFAKERSKVGER